RLLGEASGHPVRVGRSGPRVAGPPIGPRGTGGRMSEKKMCVKQNHGGAGWYPCGNRAKVERGGKWYCGVHDPVRLAKKMQERDAKWRREADERDTRWA